MFEVAYKCQKRQTGIDTSLPRTRQVKFPRQFLHLANTKRLCKTVGDNNAENSKAL